ncbi:MAG: MarR family transcriptional regulator [Pseudomonadota bacterium]
MIPGSSQGLPDAEDRNVLHVEIGPLNTENERSVRVKRNGHVPYAADGDNDVATSLDALSRLLSERNIALLQIIKTQAPRSVAELARLSGRPKASLTLTLRRLEKFGIVGFKDVDGRRKVPVVVCDRLLLEVDILDSGSAKLAR